MGGMLDKLDKLGRLLKLRTVIGHRRAVVRFVEEELVDRSLVILNFGVFIIERLFINFHTE